MPNFLERDMGHVMEKNKVGKIEMEKSMIGVNLVSIFKQNNSDSYLIEMTDTKGVSKLYQRGAVGETLRLQRGEQSHVDGQMEEIMYKRGGKLERTKSA